MLLAVYLVMMVLLSLHTHPQGVHEDNECYQCANHLPHAGHLSTTQAAMHDCVLCQLQSMGYVLATIVTVAVLLPAAAVVFAERRQEVPVGMKGLLCSRAPPRRC